MKKLDDKTSTAHLKIVRDAQAEIPLRFRWMLLNRAVGKVIEELKAEQGDAEDLVHLALPSVEEASFDTMKPRLRALQRLVPMLQHFSWIEEKVISGLLMPSLMLEDARRTLIHDTAKRCAQSLEAYPLGDVDDVAVSHFLSLCQSFRALLAFSSDEDLSLAGTRTAVLARSRPCSQTSLQSRPRSCMCKGRRTQRGAISWHWTHFWTALFPTRWPETWATR